MFIYDRIFLNFQKQIDNNEIEGKRYFFLLLKSKVTNLDHKKEIQAVFRINRQF